VWWVSISVRDGVYRQGVDVTWCQCLVCCAMRGRGGVWALDRPFSRVVCRKELVLKYRLSVST